MVRRPPVSTRTDTLCPYTTLFRSDFSPYDYQAIASAGYGHKFIENERTRLSTEVGPGFRRARDAETGEVENGVVGRDLVDFKPPLTDHTEIGNASSRERVGQHA